jgi:hypothetical protein
MLKFHTISVLHADNTLWNVLFGTTPDKTELYNAISRRYALFQQRFEPVSSRKQVTTRSVKHPISVDLIQKWTSGFDEFI